MCAAQIRFYGPSVIAMVKRPLPALLSSVTSPQMHQPRPAAMDLFFKSSSSAVAYSLLHLVERSGR